MTTATMSAAHLLQVSEPEFDAAVLKMTMKDLLGMITVLQTEMSREQEHFNSLSVELASLKRNSGQYKSVSKDMNASQTRLTMLMNRSMKCFSQQTSQQGAQRRNSQGSTGGRLQRSNSAHENVGTAQAVTASVNKPNRNSVASVLDTKTDKQEVRPTTPVTNGDKSDSKRETQSSVVQIKPLKPVSNQVNRTSVEVKPVKTDPEKDKEPSQTSFAEAKSKLKSVFDPQENKNINTQLNVSSNVNRSQTFAVADTKRMSNGLQFDLSKTEADTEKDSNTKENVNLNAAVVNGSSFMAKSNIKTNSTDNSGKTSLGPMASQKKFISTSTGNLHTEYSNSDKAKSEVVKGLQFTKPKSVLVMSADKQFIDLDSFTTRKNMLAEIKQFDKELKQTKTRDSRETKLTEIGSMTGGTYKVAEKKPDESANKKRLLDDIKLSKKPSEIKSYEEKHVVYKDNNTDTVDAKINDNKLTKAMVDSKPPGDQKEITIGNKHETEKKTPADIEIKIAESPDVSSQMQRFDDLLSTMERQEVASSSSTQQEALPDVAVINEPRETLPEPEHATEVGKGQRTPEPKETKNISEDERYVTEFQFKQPKVKEEKLHKPAKKEAPVIVQKDVQIKEAAASAPGVKGHGQQEQATQNAKVVANNDDDEGEEVVQQARINLIDWDPSALLEDLYKIQMMPDTTVDISHKFIGMEGLMEKLPMNKKKATLLKTWKRRFFKAADGWLHYYETGSRDRPSDSLQLMGGKIEELGPRVLGVDDGRGKYLMVRVPTDQEYGQWKVALESQTADNVKATYVTPVQVSPPHPKKKVIIIDIGSSSIRAGILGEKPSLPQIFFPTIVAVNKQSGELTVGIDAYKPSVRKCSKIIQPIRPTNKVDKGITREFNVDMEVMPEIFKKVFSDLKVNPQEFLVMLSTPQSLGDKLKESLMKILLEQFKLRGVCMVPQSLLALYSYNSTSGIIVDIGERMEILPIYDGLLIEGGVSRQSYGGAKVQDSLYLSLLQNKYKFNTTVEKLLVRHICEEACYVAEDYKEATAKCEKDPDSFKTTVYLSNYGLPEEAYMSVDLDLGCFKSPEGFFNTDLWGMDYPNIHKLIYQGIQQSPMDARKHMYRSVYLSGGMTMVPGFAERLQKELIKLAPPTVTVEVHAAPQRYHAAYIGACAVASMTVFEQSCVSLDEWKKLGLKACRKWGTG